MTNLFGKDFKDFLKALNNHDVEYILVGGYAVILHGYNRTTGDMDIWVKKSEENYRRIVLAFEEFKMPVFDMTLENFLNNPEMDVFSFGVPPIRIDLMTEVKGLTFDDAYQRKIINQIEDTFVKLIHKEDLIKAKMAVKRYKDLSDIEHLKDLSDE